MIRVVDPGSRIRMLTFYPSRIPIPDPVKKAPELDPQHWETCWTFLLTKMQHVSQNATCDPLIQLFSSHLPDATNCILLCHHEKLKVREERQAGVGRYRYLEACGILGQQIIDDCGGTQLHLLLLTRGQHQPPLPTFKPMLWIRILCFRASRIRIR
jgi:hypothetical protein